MKEITFSEISSTVAQMCVKSNLTLADGVISAYNHAIQNEKNQLPKSIIADCIKNAEIAAHDSIPLCQDTGIAVFFVKMGFDVKITGGNIYDAINRGVAEGYSSGYLRKSLLNDPLYDRKNTGDNTPAIIHLDMCDGDNLEITVMPKGGGAENMSAIRMLTPSAGEKGVIDFVTETILKAGGNPCPPIVIGIGIGSNFEGCALLAKKALLRDLGSHNEDGRYKALEEKILTAVNDLDIGPQGFGGKTTAFAVNIEYSPCHLASLPVAININCHIHRKITVRL